MNLIQHTSNKKMKIYSKSKNGKELRIRSLVGLRLSVWIWGLVNTTDCMEFLKESIILKYNQLFYQPTLRIKNLTDYIQVITLMRSIPDILLMELFL